MPSEGSWIPNSKRFLRVSVNTLCSTFRPTHWTLWTRAPGGALAAGTCWRPRLALAAATACAGVFGLYSIQNSVLMNWDLESKRPGVDRGLLAERRPGLSNHMASGRWPMSWRWLRCGSPPGSPAILPESCGETYNVWIAAAGRGFGPAPAGSKSLLHESAAAATAGTPLPGREECII